MKDLDEALALVLEGIEPLETESIPLTEARGRVIAVRGARAVIDLPPFDRTAMDGFAVRAADVAPGAELRVIGDLAAGGATLAVEPGTAARISTGAAIPEGADAVLPIEDAEVRNGIVIADAISRPRPATSAAAARICTPATCWRGPGTCSPSHGSPRWPRPAWRMCERRGSRAWI